jgi:hypothetical protein
MKNSVFAKIPQTPKPKKNMLENESNDIQTLNTDNLKY